MDTNDTNPEVTGDDQSEPKKTVDLNQLRKWAIIGGRAVLAGIAIAVIVKQQNTIASLTQVSDVHTEVLDSLVDAVADV